MSDHDWLDGWMLRRRASIPLWWAGEGDEWVQLAHAVWWHDERDAVLAVVEHLGPMWGEVATLQPSAAAADEYALWFAECWDHACVASGLDPLLACCATPSLLVAAFLRGVLAGQGTPMRLVTPRWAEAAQQWAWWSLGRRDALLADLEAPPSTA